MSTISEVQVERAIVHIVNHAEPTKSVISQYELPLFSNVHLRSYFEEQIAKVLVNPAVSKAVFNVNALSPGSPANLCFAAMKDPKNFLESSHGLGNALLFAMRGDSRISAAYGFAICLYTLPPATDNYLALLLLSASDTPAQKIVRDRTGHPMWVNFGAREYEDEIPIIHKHLRKAALIMPERSDKEYDVLVLDKQTPGKLTRFFARGFLGVRQIADAKMRTDLFYMALERAHQRLATDKSVLGKPYLNERQAEEFLEEIGLVMRQSKTDVRTWLSNLTLPEDAKEIVRSEIQRHLPAEKEFDLDPDHASNEVLFTALYPRVGKVETWHILLVYAHLASAIKAVRQDVERFKDKLPKMKESRSPASARIARGTEITIIPTCDDVEFNPRQMNIKWMEDYHRVEFHFRANKSLIDDAAKGTVTIFIGPLIIATLKLVMLFTDTEEVSSPDHEESSKMYHKDKIFISYSHKDTDIVLAFRKVYRAIGYDVLIDIDNLRSGQEWNPQLMRMIDRADIFQLFWSENSKKSKYCKQEWKYALSRAMEGFIRPFYWRIPLPKPPRELSKLHFEYVEL